MMYNFIQLAYFAKAKGHKYIKRIPVGTTASGRTKYRYVYNVTSTVGGKHLLDEAHLKVGTKLMLTSKSGEEVHAHIVGVKGDKVTIRYDDGEKKDQNRTVSKKDLLKEFNQEHGIEQKIKEAREATQAQLSEALKNNVSEKQLKRIQDRIDRLTLETSSSEPSKLHKELLQKHKVNAQQVEASINEWKKTRGRKESNPDIMMLGRLIRIKADDNERACNTYNNLLEKSASDNQAVLKAVEAYQDFTSNPYNDPELMNQVTKLKAGHRQFFDKKLDMKYADISKLDIFVAYNLIENVKMFTGIDLEENKDMTIGEACEHLNSKDIKHAEKRAINRLRAGHIEQAKLALSLVKQEIEKSCADFNFTNNKYKTGDIHKNHKVANALEGKALKSATRDSHLVAFIEDKFEEAYPDRVAHTTILDYSRSYRAFAKPARSTSSIHIHESNGIDTRAHELAHTLEGVNTRADYQLPIQEAVTLSHMTRIERGTHEVYSGSERAFGDKYADLYTGKLYKDGATEFVSMGVEKFFASSDPDTQISKLADFAVSDPHHFLTTYGILKGYAKHE